MWFSSCGYTLQNSKNPLLLKQGIQKIYVAPLINNTYKAGVENVVYNSLIRALRAYGRVTLVSMPDDADAVLQGTVQTATYSASARATVTQLLPTVVATAAQLPTAGYAVSTEYMAALNCSFSLDRQKVPLGKKKLVWAAGFNRSKPFPAANQLDVPGTTSALINDSEFDRALLDLSRSMMDDVHESMLAMF